MPNNKGAVLPINTLYTSSQPLPIYQQIKRMIMQKVHSGEWGAHYNVPSEKELTQLFNVSRMTVNRALRELTAQGILVRIQGVGTFVSEIKGESALMSVRNISDEIQAINHKYSAELILLEKCLASQELAATFEVMAGQMVYHSILVHYDNDMPVQLEDRFVNSDVVPDYLNQNFTRQTPHAYLMSVAPLTEGEHIVEAVLPSEKEAAWLQITPASPCLQVQRKTWSQNKVVTSARLLYPGSRYRLEGHFYS
ncbi:MAG: histidine utilization repressor [Enterobacteriaceae bacterium]